MSAKIIDGRQIAAKIRATLKEKISVLPLKPHLAIILIGNDDASVVYVRNKQKAAQEIGARTTLYHLPETTDSATVLQLIEKLNNDKDVNGIIVQLPLPEHFNVHEVIHRISPLKDVDGFHPYNTGMLQNNEDPYFIAATPLGIMKLIQNVETELSGKNVVIIGASLIVGRPLATLLLNHECTVTVTHIHTRNIKELTQKADIVIAACGVANMVKNDWIKKGVILIDVGINRLEGKICGDIDFADVCDTADAITPVPGGVGPMTIASLMLNTVELCEIKR
mgnify:CR=1 FL=1